MKSRSLLTITLAAASLCAFARGNQASVLDIKESITDSNIVFPESFETDTQKLLESWYMKNYTATDDAYRSSDVETSDDEIRRRLAKLPTVIDMPFNSIVRSYIDRYTRRGRAQVAATLGLGLYYLPIFEQALEEEGLPLELKYLPVVESALNPNAVSKRGATGLWQFMLATGRGLGMEINSLVDERRDPYVSSRKAAKYLKDLYNSYGDWSLAIAAYNCGPGSVNKAIRRAGEGGKKDFWSIYQYLTPETRGYVPAFIAANYVMNYHDKHGINPVLSTKPLVTDTIGVSDRVHFNQISHVLDIPVEELRLLNPQFRADIIPGNPDKTYFLVLPSQQIHAYLVSEDQIKAYDAERYARRETAEPGDGSLLAENVEAVDLQPAEVNEEEIATVTNSDDAPAIEPKQAAQPAQPQKKSSQRRPQKTLTHKVAAGETLASIAEKYDVPAADIKRWNNLRRNSVRVGQHLRIMGAATGAQATAQPVAQTKVSESASKADKKTTRNNKTQEKAEKKSRAKQKQKAQQPTNHYIRNGENLTIIAKKYGVTVDELRKANNMKNDDLRAGDNIKIPAKKSTKSKSGKSKKSKKSKKRR